MSDCPKGCRFCKRKVYVAPEWQIKRDREMAIHNRNAYRKNWRREFVNFIQELVEHNDKPLPEVSMHYEEITTLINILKAAQERIKNGQGRQT